MSVRPHPTKSTKEPGKWWVIDIGRGKERERITFNGSYEEAWRYERSIRQQPDHIVEGSVPKIKDMVAVFLEWYRTENSINTVNDMRCCLDNHIIPWFGNFQPKQLTVALFNKFKADLLGLNLAPVTINKNLSYLSSLLKWATEHGYCQPLAFTIPRFSKKKTTAEPVQPLTRRQLDALYECLDPEYRLLFLLMADHGLRKEEALNLRVEDIDEARKTIRVYGKGSKYRIVPFLSLRFEGELNKILSERLEGYLVVNPETGKPYYSIRKVLARAAKKAGLSRQVYHHLLRHTFGSLAAEAGMNPYALQRIMGHSNIETTNKIYTHVGLDFVGEEARKIREQGVDQ